MWLETQCSRGTCLACAPLDLHYYKSKEHKAGTAYSTAIRMSDHKVSISREHNALQSSLETSHAHFKWPKMIAFPLNYLRTVHTSNHNSSTTTHIKRHTYVTLGRLLLPLTALLSKYHVLCQDCAYKRNSLHSFWKPK